MTLIFSSVSEILTVQSSTDFSNYVYVNFTAGLGIRNISGKKEKFQELFWCIWFSSSEYEYKLLPVLQNW